MRLPSKDAARISQNDFQPQMVKGFRPLTGDRLVMCARHNSAFPELSLHAEAFREAERHKWIESQKQGRDLGEYAIREWYRLYWLCYCRVRRLEHLQGRRRWQEFGDDDFGQIYSLIIAGDLLVDRILDRVYQGDENLGIINWAIDWGLPIPRVLDILAQLDVNRARIEPVGIC